MAAIQGGYWQGILTDAVWAEWVVEILMLEFQAQARELGIYIHTYIVEGGTLNILTSAEL